MGETAAQTEREIAELRRQLERDLGELRRRVGETLDVRAQLAGQARRRPGLARGVAAGTGLLVGVGGGWLGWRFWQERQRARRPARAFDLLVQAREIVQGRAERVRQELPIEVTVRRAGAPAGRTAEEWDRMQTRQPGIVKRWLWAGLVAGLAALASLLARRVAVEVWQRVLRERPPTPA